jgi:shikimate dehydrogenase
LDRLDDGARGCGAVNTVVNEDGLLAGYNTDMGGLLSALAERGLGYAGRRIAILGAGGAAAGIVFKAALEGAERITLLARRPEQADEIQRKAAHALKAGVETLAMTAEKLRDAAAGADLLINATPLGMEGVEGAFPSLKFLRALPSGAAVCDLVYKPPETPLLREAAALGHAVMNGLDMLIHQALLSDELFLGRKLDKGELSALVRDALRQGGEEAGLESPAEAVEGGRK